MLIELHSHTSEHSSCSHVRARDLVRAVYRRGAAGLVLTDHNYLWSYEEILNMRAGLNVPDEFLILSGQEVFTSDFGDVLVYGAPRAIDERITLGDLRAVCPDAALVWAHPYRSGLRPSGIELFDSNLDAVEILNPHQKPEENTRGQSDWKTWGFTATSGTDIHSVEIPVFYATRFDLEIGSMHDLVHAIKEGRCHPSTEVGSPVNQQAVP